MGPGPTDPGIPGGISTNLRGDGDKTAAAPTSFTFPASLYLKRISNDPLNDLVSIRSLHGKVIPNAHLDASSNAYILWVLSYI